MRAISPLSILGVCLVAAASVSAQFSTPPPSASCPYSDDLYTPGTLRRSSYLNNERCTWVIHSSQRYTLLSITSFNTETCCDTLTIYAGEAATGTSVATLRGVLTGGTTELVVESDTATLVFYSDSSIVGTGFSVSYSAVSTLTTNYTNECFLGMHNCDTYRGRCVNTATSYLCTCNAGYYQQGSQCSTNSQSPSCPGCGNDYDYRYDDDGHGDLGGLAIAGIVLGVLGCTAFVGTAVGLLIWCQMRKNRKVLQQRRAGSVQMITQQQQQLPQGVIAGAVLGQPVQALPGTAVYAAIPVGAPSAPPSSFGGVPPSAPPLSFAPIPSQPAAAAPPPPAPTGLGGASEPAAPGGTSADLNLLQ